jgi:hypothetical protein
MKFQFFIQMEEIMDWSSIGGMIIIGFILFLIGIAFIALRAVYLFIRGVFTGNSEDIYVARQTFEILKKM